MIHVEFLKKGSPFGFAYMAGQTGEIPNELQAKELEALGVVKIIEQPCDLPANLPGRKKLIEAGITLMADLNKISDFSELNIGKLLAKQITDYLNSTPSTPSTPSTSSGAKI